jgi:hypothetical protein
VGLELDHLFVCTASDAPEAEPLNQFGLREGPPNQHPGQGTACRRFAFVNAMIELLWVSNPTEAQNEITGRTLLWERWSDREGNACPFGICLRPTDSQHAGPPPFTSWEYRPAYLPDPLVMHVGEAGIEEPMWVYMSFMKRAQRGQWFIEHPIGIREITGLTLTTATPPRSEASQKVVESGILATRTGPTSLLEIEFDGNRRQTQIDFQTAPANCLSNLIGMTSLRKSEATALSFKARFFRVLSGGRNCAERCYTWVFDRGFVQVFNSDVSRFPNEQRGNHHYPAVDRHIPQARNTTCEGHPYQSVSPEQSAQSFRQARRRGQTKCPNRST